MARILVIDDEPSMLELLDTVLRRKGHEVVLTEHGRKGLQLFQQERPHVTILDLLMPEVGGLPFSGRFGPSIHTPRSSSIQGLQRMRRSGRPVSWARSNSSQKASHCTSWERCWVVS